MMSPQSKQATESQRHRENESSLRLFASVACKPLTFDFCLLTYAFVCFLPGQPDRQLAFLQRLRAQDLTKRIRQRVRLARHTDATAIDRAEQVEHLADQLDAAATKLHRFAHTHIEPLVFVALDLRLRNRRQTTARPERVDKAQEL